MLNTIASLYRRKIRPFSKLIQAICIPIFALAIPLSIGNKQSYCGYVMIIMSSFWLLETIPMAATSLLPILLFPLFGIMTSRDVTSVYIQDILMLFLAVIVLTQSIRSSGLNERLSLKIILLFGSNPKFLLLGIMCITWFLSIWISNNASVCMMMFPITVEIAKYLIQVNEAVTAEIKKCHQLVSFGTENSVERVDFDDGQEPSRESLFEENSEAEPSDEYSKESQKILKAFCLSVSFSSTIGGSGSLIASPPNILLKGFLDEKFPNNNINFLSFFLYSLPFTFTMLISAWIVLCLLYIPRGVSRKSIHSEKIIEQEPLKRAIKRKYNEYGSLNWEQKSVGTFFIVLILLWLTRDIYWIKGWSYFFPKGYVTDTTPAILILLLVTIWPKENIFAGKEYKNLIDWKMINQSFPWNILLFAGGSFALSKGFEKSKLSNTIGSLLQTMMPAEKELALGLIVILSEIGTEFTCNFSMSSILLPIVNSLHIILNTFFLFQKRPEGYMNLKKKLAFTVKKVYKDQISLNNKNNRISYNRRHAETASIWYSLPNQLVEAPNFNSFKAGIDCWMSSNQSKYDQATGYAWHVIDKYDKKEKISKVKHHPPYQKFLIFILISSQKNNIDPLYLLMHTVMAINFSFMLPIATPTNSIVFASGHVKTKDMLISGGILKIAGILVIFLFSSTWYQFLHDNSLLLVNVNTDTNTTLTHIYLNKTA